MRRLREGELSSRELVEHYLRRIEDEDARLNAVVALDADGALRAADEADRLRARGHSRPLLGLPVTVKDSLEVAGLVATGGSRARADHVPDRDATAVARLRAAGAIVLAKTNLPEYSASYETDNALHGRTVHPLDPARTPGGSSGGEAALAGADATALGLGTDGGGSIRVPAHYCGVVGLRPTVGRVPATGNWPATRASGYMDLYCVGPIARFVADVALALAVIAGPDGVDPYAPPVRLAKGPPPDPAGMRVGWLAESPRVEISSGTASAVDAAVEALAEAGATTRRVEPPWDPDPTALFLSAIAADGGAQMRRDVAGAGGEHHPEFAALLETMAARALSAEAWFVLQGEVFALRAAVRALFDDVDVLVCPVAAGPAPPHGRAPGPGGDADDAGLPHAFDFVHLIALAGLPAVSVPVGSEDGLPVGVQVAGPPFREDVVLAVAGALEAA
jgi:Asp-tRNA(Asn)/Glu-tRNA(Gln) amidotransferase A subunit family amidase